MRNKFEFLGIKSPERKKLQQELIRHHGIPCPDAAENIVRELWKLPEREFQYFAMDILYRTLRKQNDSLLSLCEYMILSKSWWDTVDFIAASIAGTYLKLHPEKILPVTGRWMESGNLWLQRSCLLIQLKFKNHTDLELLYTLIEKLKDSDEFFIRKAIGWSLREYSKTDPMEILNFVNSQSLKPLSRKEALKVIERKANAPGK